MLIQVKSNGLQQEISKEVWENMSADMQRNYSIVRNADIAPEPKAVENTVKAPMPETGTDKKK